MGIWRALLLALAMGSGPGAGLAGERIATVLGKDISPAELATAGDDGARGTRLLELIWDRVMPHYVAEHGLAATPDEVAEVLAYEREFRRKDRAQRARKLAELERRLGADGLSPDERAYLEDFRATLRRMAQRDKEQDRAPPPAAAEQQAAYKPWIEMWKMNRSLYERFGGVVVRTRNGPSPQGAHAALIADYESRGLITFFDPALREEVRSRLRARPSLIVPSDRVDFTPYWRLPIPPSYFPD